MLLLLIDFIFRTRFVNFEVQISEGKFEIKQANLWRISEILAVDVLSDEPPERLDVVDGGPEGVHLARLGEKAKV